MRRVAESFGTDPARYDRTRPRYPDAMAAAILAASPDAEAVLDVGCGTGISSQPFRRSARRLLGVEVDPRMAEFARRSGIEVDVARFESWNPAGRKFDLVISGQAWHWVEPVAGAAKAAEILRPAGRLAVFWNAFDPSPDLAEAFSAVYRRVLPDLPARRSGGMPTLDSYSTLFANASDGMLAVEKFSEPQQWRFDWQRSYTREEWLDQVPSFGGHSLVPADKLKQLLAGLGKEIDAAGGSFSMPYATVVITATRLQAP